MADLVNHKNRMSKSSPILGHMHAESNTMASGYTGVFQFWKSKEQGKPFKE
jgi:acyl-[acyl carrier protein]--UDP-N-acetylglucosamine O-acyltransferase